ncbi:TPA: lanthionine synthetase LanC family protein [Elizabethkingia anophelis]
MQKSRLFEYSSSSKIHDIEEAISKHISLITSISIKEGLIGISLFYYYYYLFTQDEKYLRQVSKYLNESIDRLHSSQLEVFTQYDLQDLGRYVSFLTNEGLMSIKEAKMIVKEIDPFVNELLEKQLAEKNFESVLGSIGLGYYYLETIPLKDRNKTLERIIEVIDSSGIRHEKDEVFWYFNNELNRNEQKIKSLGATNGQTGILHFLLQLCQVNIKPSVCKNLISDGVAYMLKYRSSRLPFISFPDKVDPMAHISYQSLAYGDIGIGNFLFQYGQAFQMEEYIDLGLEIMARGALYRDDTGKYCKDAALLHGASGMFALFENYSNLSNHLEICEAALYWYDRIIYFGSLETEWAGFKTYYNGYDDRFQLTFGYGLAGIGISLIAHQLKMPPKYLSLINFYV